MPPTTQQLQRDTLRIRRLRDEVHPDTYARAIPTLDLCLQYLRLDAIPDRPILPYALMDLAWAALMCLSKIVFVSTRKEVKEPLQKTTVAKVLPGFEGIIAWLDTCMAQRPHCRPEHGSYSRAAELLLGLLILDPSLEPLVHGSSVAMKLALKLWWNCTEDGSAVTVELTAQLLVGDPFVHLMFFIIQKTDLLFDYITSAHGGPRKFCYALVYRIKYLVALHQDKNLLDSLFIKHAMMVLNITRRAQTNQSLHRRLRKEHYLECWTVATNTIQPRLIQSDIHPQASSSVLSYFATSLLDIATAPGAHSVRGFTTLLRSDIFPILVYLLRYSSPILQHEDDRKRAKIFNMLGGYALYPRSCTALLRAINGIPQDAVDEIRAVPYLVDYWDGWTYTIELVANCRALALGFDNLPLDRLCSYSGHRLWSHSWNPRNPRPFKECSGCHTVLYCSSRCQKADWKARHRRECAHMQESYLERRERKVKYTNALRMHHIVILTESFGLPLQHASRVFEARRRGHNPNNAINILDFAASEGSHSPSIRTQTIEEYLETTDFVSDCSAMDARVDKMMRDFQRRTSPVKTRLTEALIPWGTTQRIAILFEHLDDGAAGLWGLVRTSVRFEEPKFSAEPSHAKLIND